MNVIFVGAGKASVKIIDYFEKCEDVSIVAVVDTNDASPGMQRARQLGILTSKDIEGTIAREDVDLILEVTGSKEVLNKIISYKRADQDVMSCGGAWIMNQAVENISHKQEGIAHDLDGLSNQMKSILHILDDTVADVRNILTKMDMLSINGSIAAGQSGSNDFVIIAERMGTLAKEVDSAMRQILESSQKGNDVIKSILEAEKRLVAA